MTAWRYRRCPHCGRIHPAGKLRPVEYGAHWNAKGYAERQCPSCGTVAPTMAFAVVRDLRKRPTKRQAPAPKPASVSVGLPWWAE